MKFGSRNINGVVSRCVRHSVTSSAVNDDDECLDDVLDLTHTTHLLSRVCKVVHYAVLEAIHAVYGIWQIRPLCK